MRKISNVATGIPLRNTSPAAIEDFLVKKVRSDLGDLTDIATVRPMLRVDSEDGDLSGNITNGYGTVMVTVNEKTLHLPFIISDKELLPFDSIRMGEDEVSYDMGKLRQLVIALEKHKPKEIGGGNDVMEVVDIRDVPTHNGFLGTIMSIRDEHKARDTNGQRHYRGESFGDVDEGRILKRASVEVDVAETFEEFHEKLASVKFFSSQDVDNVVEGLRKQAETESQKMIDSVKQITLDTKETNSVKREMAQIDKTRLVDAKRSASGNNVRFPVFDDNRFEFRNGRVYHNIKALADHAKTGNVKRIVLDSKGEYAFLSDSDKFMLDTEAPEVDFDLATESGRGMEVGNMYAVEADKSTLYTPFTVEKSFRVHYQESGMLISVRERIKEKGENPVNPLSNTIFRDALECQSVIGDQHSRILILVLKDSEEGFRKIDKFKELSDYIAERAQNPSDISNAKFLSDYLFGGGSGTYLVGENAKVFKMTRKIAGHFTRPDGLFKEGPLFHKEAAYEQSNKARLIINEQKKPATYTVAWSFAEDKDVEGQAAYNMQKRELKDLAPAQAKKVLSDLGYDARKQEMFFEIAKRNGRYAEFRLPDVNKASNVSPQDAGANKAKTAAKNIANSTLNAKNFVPVMQDMAVDGLSGAVRNMSDRFAKQAETSHEVAVQFEKVAENIRGKEWAEIAYLMNMKHHMDKLACQISEGFVKDAEPVFEEVANLEKVIEKKASLLLDFNRQQLVRSSKPLVDPHLIKQAMQQFDEMTGYIAARDTMEKQASFFHKGVRNKIESIEQTFKHLKGKENELSQELREKVIDLRTLEQKGLKGTEEYQKAGDEMIALYQQMVAKGKELGSLKGQQVHLQEGIADKNRIATAAIGIPGIAALSYGYQGFKDSK